jgi:hypothetical protein
MAVAVQASSTNSAEREQPDVAASARFGAALPAKELAETR